jgi:hypothetical protein
MKKRFNLVIIIIFSIGVRHIGVTHVFSSLLIEKKILWPLQAMDEANGGGDSEGIRCIDTTIGVGILRMGSESIFTLFTAFNRNIQTSTLSIVYHLLLHPLYHDHINIRSINQQYHIIVEEKI